MASEGGILQVYQAIVDAAGLLAEIYASEVQASGYSSRRLANFFVFSYLLVYYTLCALCSCGGPTSLLLDPETELAKGTLHLPAVIVKEDASPHSSLRCNSIIT